MGDAYCQDSDVREATGLPIQIGTPVIYGHVKFRGIADGEKRPQVFVALFLGGSQVDRVQVNDRGYYYFLRSPSNAAVLVFEADNIEVGRVVLMSQIGSTVRRDIEIDWLKTGRNRDGPPGVISARDSYARSPEAEKEFDTGLAASRAKRSGDAKMIFERMLVKDEKDYAAWTELASLYFNDSEFKKAETAYVKALELKNDFMAALVNLGKLYLITKEPEKATLVLTKAVMTDPGSANAFHFLGEAYLQTKQGSKAVPALNEAIRLKPVEKAELHLRLAALYDAAGVKDRAAAEYKLFLEKVPDFKNRSGLERYIKENSNQP